MAITQKDRTLSITTPLGEDFLLLNSLSLDEGISRLFTCEVQLLHEENEEGFEPTDVEINSILGQGVAIEILQMDGTSRILTGIVNSFSKGGRDERFSYYYATIVPHVWVLTQNVQSRIFQQKSVPEILETVLAGFEFTIETEGEFNTRNYCVQYNETDFDFISRLMEEEGFYYYFDFTDAKHKLIIANTPKSHNECPGKVRIPFASQATSDEGFVSAVRNLRTEYKFQSGKVARRDRNFQLPTNKLEGSQLSKNPVGDNQNMEVYEYPGGYAVKYDDVDRMGGEGSGHLNGIFPDKQRTIENAIQVFDAQFMVSDGNSDCCSIIAGHRFELINHPNKKLNTKYVVVSVRHQAQQSPSYETGESEPHPYTNGFRCIPLKVPFRPPRVTGKPVMQGNQTAIVVGPSGEEIFTDKFGRVKVQFHWDREGGVDESSSCWIRVAQAWAGNRWGMMMIPRIGMEVIVNFLNGNPDDPIITGCVYNPEAMPPYALPDEKTKSTIKSDSTKGGGGFNEVRFDDEKDKEQIFVHAQRDVDLRVRRDRRELIGSDTHLIVNRDKRERIKRDEHRIVERDLIEQIERDYHLIVSENVAVNLKKEVSTEIGENLDEKVGGDHAAEVSGSYSLKARQIVLEAQTGISLVVGGNFITINSGGIYIQGTMVNINSGGASLPPTSPTPVAPLEPEEAHVADNADPGSKMPTYKNQKREMPNWKKPTFTKPTHRPNHPNNKDKKSWIEIELVDEDNKPVPGVRYRVTLPDGQTLAEGTLNKKGYAKVSNIDPGTCKVTFPEMDKSNWKKI